MLCPCRKCPGHPIGHVDAQAEEVLGLVQVVDLLGVLGRVSVRATTRPVEPSMFERPIVAVSDSSLNQATTPLLEPAPAEPLGDIAP